MSSTTIRLAVVDDHILFRKGLRALISGFPGMEVLFEAGDGQELLERLDQGVIPDVILMDLQMPVLDGLQTVRLLRAQYPQVRSIIISMHDEPELIDSLRAEGAHGYLLKNASPEEVRGAIHSVIDNRPNSDSSRFLLTTTF
ncbi:DNA-binding NarL/FixJ family response regulator [Hymenobacter luteus]|uniref:DNA-binding NarL/FixJ family response regulator n=2 Tax=Hymenobacter TaxID=89966 RepID=A0A7W9WAS7_9BACT|nr:MULTISPECIES: response regulator transcription factor [Hymenobacter]MBB4600729.1 DNA-binding NarL/FixJ family response regulator [Hymenobacter latericoloratus]MBB6059064.1 DNA-binding NarL/FixJ family response regulator [Hymenobacter luteus]